MLRFCCWDYGRSGTPVASPRSDPGLGAVRKFETALDKHVIIQRLQCTRRRVIGISKVLESAYLYSLGNNRCQCHEFSSPWIPVGSSRRSQGMGRRRFVSRQNVQA